MRPVAFTNVIAQELSGLYGSHEAAKILRNRQMLPAKPIQEEVGQLDKRVIIISDLHIGAGPDPETGRLDPLDDYTAEMQRQLTHYLHNEWHAAEHGNSNLVNATMRHLIEDLQVGIVAQAGVPAYSITLCLNGDILDLLQTCPNRPGVVYPDGYTDDGMAIKNTPANAITQLHIIYQGHRAFFQTLAMHLRRGHKIDYVIGNHDRHLYNDHVWRQLKLCVLQELEALNLTPAQCNACLSRFQRKPFSIYADVFVEHGDNSDGDNRVQRPLGELFSPSDLHAEMSMALGDYGVRLGFNFIEKIDRSLDTIVPRSGKFWRKAFRHPILALKMIWGFFRAAAKEGYKTSKEHEAAVRQQDAAGLVDRYPFIMESLNALRPNEDKLTAEQIKAGLAEIEKKSATPFLSNFKEGTSFFSRLLTLIFQVKDKRSEEEVYLDTADSMNHLFGMNCFVRGHSHQAADDTFITERGTLIQAKNAHTWMEGTELAKHSASMTWGNKSRGVVVVEIGSDKAGRVWREAKLMRVVGEGGDLVEGDMYEEELGNPGKQKVAAKAIFEATQKMLAAQIK